MRRVRQFVVAGLLAAGASGVGSVSAEEMTFRLTPMDDPARCARKCVRVVVADGEIASSTPGNFIRFVREHIRDKSVRSVIFLNSPGGKVLASMELGMAFRRLGAATVVARVVPSEPGSGMAARFTSARCFSACVYALMGGKKRVVPPQSFVGIHRMFMLEARRDPDSDSGQSLAKVFADNDLVGSLSRYVGMMGVSRDLVRTAESTSPERVYLVSPRELKAWRLGSQKF